MSDSYKPDFASSFLNLDSEQKLGGGYLDPLAFKNLPLFIAHKVKKNWQKLDINSFLVFKNLTKTDKKNKQKLDYLDSTQFSKNQILKK